MPKFKIQATVMEELPEMEIEADTLEEAKEKYEELYEEGKVESEEYSILFSDEEFDEDEEDSGEEVEEIESAD